MNPISDPTTIHTVSVPGNVSWKSEYSEYTGGSLSVLQNHQIIILTYPLSTTVRLYGKILEDDGTTLR